MVMYGKAVPMLIGIKKPKVKKAAKTKDRRDQGRCKDLQYMKRQ